MPDALAYLDCAKMSPMLRLAAEAGTRGLERKLHPWAIEACTQHGIDTVVLNGGCLANRLLDDALTQHLQDAGLQVWRASHYPCGDGGLSLGQAWVAHQRLTAPVSLID